MLTTEFNIEKAKQVWQEEFELKGKLEGIVETAKKMLRKGVDFLTISEYTDLDYDTIQRLADSR
ncbi:hypothetical protein FACS1894133_5640 [Clostridia bacterium]|nr:hypothetical protein FACS1894133_5640 [Clostridia bacterium]